MRASLCLLLGACSPPFSLDDPEGPRGAGNGADTASAQGTSGGSAPGAEDSELGDTGGTGTADPDACPTGVAYPTPTWPTALPEDHGLDPLRLARAAEYAGLHASNCMVVIRHGAIVGEWYWQGTAPTTRVKNWSVAKSVAATVVGVALERGDLPSLDAPAADWIPTWQGTEHEAITLRDLLSMSSGLKFDMIADNVTLPLAEDMTSLAVAAPVTAPPGARWEYNNHSVQAMEPVLRAATGMAADDYADAHLFGPIGMDVDWKRDERGQPALYMNAKASCRDNARLAYLMMHDGCWEGERLLSSEFVEDALGPSTSHNRGYGYWWWKNGQDPTLDSVTFEDKGHTLHPYAPDDAFCAVGLGSQFVEAIPSLDLVVVRLGTAPHDDLANWLDPLALYEAISSDGEQVVHNGVLERVLDAVVE